MKHVVAIVGSALVFTLVGLLAAWGAVEYGFPQVNSGQGAVVVIIFAALPAAGFVMGCIAGLLGVSAASRAERQPRVRGEGLRSQA